MFKRKAWLVESCKPPPDFSPRTNQGGKRGNGADGRASTLAPLCSIIQPDGGRPGGGIFSGERNHVGAINSSERFHSFRRIFRRQFFQRVESLGIVGDIIGVVQIFSDDHVHQAQSERQVAARKNAEVFVGKPAGAISNRIDGVKTGAVSPRFHDKGPQMHIRSQNVRAPGDDQLGLAELFRLGAIPEAERRHQSRSTRG